MKRCRTLMCSIIAMVTASIVLGACTTNPPGASGGQPGATAASDPPKPAPPPQVVQPWRPGRRELGVSVLWEDSKADDDAVTRAKAVRLLNYLVALGANSVALDFPFVMANQTASTVAANEHTPPPDRVGIFLEEAAARGLRVALRPFLDEQTLLPSWRGLIEPSNRAAWFRSYQDFLHPYAEVAQRNNVAELTIGVELNSLQTDQRWASLVTSVRAVFLGTITYSTNYDTYEASTPNPPVDAVGVDAYFPVAASDAATVEVLAAAWRQWIEHYAGPGAKKLVLHEVGIVAQNGAYHHPAQWGNLAVPLNLQVQENWYRAVCQVVEGDKLAGVYFWNIRLHADPGHEDPQQPDRLAFVDRPAETALRDCYARLAGS